MLKTILTAAIFLAHATTAFGQVVVPISEDIGGRIGEYVARYETIRANGDYVAIDGVCFSACTLVLGIVPRERVCATSRAILGFHAAWTPDGKGNAVTSAVGTQALWEIYPAHVRHWIQKRGGLTRKMIFLRSAELFTMVPRCRTEAPASEQLVPRRVPLEYFRLPQQQ
jgi:hypothetical protein